MGSARRASTAPTASASATAATATASRPRPKRSARGIADPPRVTQPVEKAPFSGKHDGHGERCGVSAGRCILTRAIALKQLALAEIVHLAEGSPDVLACLPVGL